jgi:hypothetical protein
MERADWHNLHIKLAFHALSDVIFDTMSHQ